MCDKHPTATQDPTHGCMGCWFETQEEPKPRPRQKNSGRKLSLAARTFRSVACRACNAPIGKPCNFTAGQTAYHYSRMDTAILKLIGKRG